MFVGGWDRAVRCIDLKENAIVKHFVASKGAIQVMAMHEKKLFVGGCDPVIRSFDIETGETKMYDGHKGWVYAISFYCKHPDPEDSDQAGDEPKWYMFSGGDDRGLVMWDLDSGKIFETLTGHENAITNITFCGNDVQSASLDHNILVWDLMALFERVEEKWDFQEEMLYSYKFEWYYKQKEGGKKGKKAKKPKLPPPKGY